MMEISGDSGEYELLSEAVELIANIKGMCIEIGLRRGLGTKTIIDAVRQYCPDKRVIAIDPYGSIPYVCREMDGPVRLDYDDNMKVDCMIALWNYVKENPVRFDYFPLTSDAFFTSFNGGVPSYNINEGIDQWFSMAHLDGVHTVKTICDEVDWFSQRMESGATIVIDDFTEDFYDYTKVEQHMNPRWNLVKRGVKKAIWQKK